MMSNILIVEDDDALVRSIERNLTARRYVVRSAGSVEEALKVVEEARPNLLLLDMICRTDRDGKCCERSARPVAMMSRRSSCPACGQTRST